MAKELYVDKILTDEMIIAGKQFLRQIEAIMPITASFWLYTQETEAWRLHIVTPLALKGTRKVYEKVINILNADQEHEYILPAECVTVTDDNEHYVSLLRMMRLSDKTFDKRLTGLGIIGRYIEDTYIYRLYEAKNDEFSRSKSPVVNGENAVVIVS